MQEDITMNYIAIATQMHMMIMINGQRTRALYCNWLIEWRTYNLLSNLLIECSYLHTPVGSYMFWSYQP